MGASWGRLFGLLATGVYAPFEESGLLTVELSTRYNYDQGKPLPGIGG